MAELFMMDFPTEKIKLNVCFKRDDILAAIKKESPDKAVLPKVSAVYDELFFPQAPAGRPYTFCSVVLSSDGKMAFADEPAGPLIAKNNYLDSDGALADFWVLNALRAYADGIIIGARTLQTEVNATSHVFDREMAEQRVSILGKSRHPWNIVVSFDATDIPFEHIIFNVEAKEELQVVIATSPAGAGYVAQHFVRPHLVLGPFTSTDEIDLEAVKKQLAANQGKVPVFVTGTGNSPDSTVLFWLLRKLGLERLLIESPSYNWHLMQNKALDEFFINYSMVYAGGTITPGHNLPFTHDVHPHAELLTLGTHRSNFIYTRQKLYYDVTSSVDLSKYKY